jgi:short-subunit dehydrogenase
MPDTTKTSYAVITGGTSGIGYELARRLAQDGYNLVLVARSKEGLIETASGLENQFGTSVYTIVKDLFIPGAAKEVYTETQQQGFEVEILINDAGQGLWGKFSETDLDREIDLIHLNVIALISLTKYYLKDMLLRDKGKILQLASALAKAPSPYMSVYAASKAFVLSFTEAVISEIKDTNVTMTALLPGATDTDFFHKASSQESVTYKETSLYDPRMVAEAGYQALMKGDDKISPGLKNKMQGAMSNFMTDEATAEMMNKQMQPSTKDQGREGITHEVSLKERERINQQTGKADGDYDSHKGHIHEESPHHRPDN